MNDGISQSILHGFNSFFSFLPFLIYYEILSKLNIDFEVRDIIGIYFGQ